MKKFLAPAQPRFLPIGDIMKDPLKKAKLTNLVDAAVTCKTRISLEQESIKELREVAKTDIMISPKLFNAYVNAVFNNDYALRKDGLEQQLDLIDNIIGSVPELNDDSE